MKQMGLVMAIAALAGCPQQPVGGNPPQVWEAELNGMETMVQLSPVEPAPF